MDFRTYGFLFCVRFGALEVVDAGQIAHIFSYYHFVVVICGECPLSIILLDCSRLSSVHSWLSH